MRVCLWNLEQAALIILQPSGITYLNQTIGNTCFQSEAEGVLAPITNDPPLDNLYFGSLAYKLQKLTGNKHFLDEPDAEAIDELLATNLGGDTIRVDRTKLKDSYEAWIFVIIDENNSGDLIDFAGRKAILTYPNSD
jgi:Family of unknown function (DUF6210)